MSFKKEKFGKYTLIRQVATGGMAEVYLASTPQPGNLTRYCIIKRILPAYSGKKDFLDAIVDEARLGAALSHGNLVTTMDFDEIEGRLFLTLEYVDGPDLGGLCEALARQGMRMGIGIGCFIICQVLKGLDYTHNALDQNGRPLGIVHRDINPPNILLAKNGDVKIADFGIAHAAFRLTKTSFGQLKGKIPYMSPEQAMGNKLDGRSDIFSCGAMLYEILTGGRLFAGANEMEVLRQVREASPLPPSTFRNDLAPDLDKICLKALERDLKNRYSTSLEFLRELSAFHRENFPQDQEKELSNLIISLAGHWEHKEIKRAKTAILAKSDPSENNEKREAKTAHEPNRKKRERPLWIWATGICALFFILVAYAFFHSGNPDKKKTGKPATLSNTVIEVQGIKGMFVFFNNNLLGQSPVFEKISEDIKMGRLTIVKRGHNSFRSGTMIKKGSKKLINIGSKSQKATGEIIIAGKIPDSLLIDDRAADIFKLDQGHFRLPTGPHILRWKKGDNIYQRFINVGEGGKELFIDF